MKGDKKILSEISTGSNTNFKNRIWELNWNRARLPSSKTELTVLQCIFLHVLYFFAIRNRK